MKAFYVDAFVLPLPDRHRFPMAKYALLRERVTLHLPQVRLEVPAAATDAELCLAHDPAYVRAVVQGTLTAREVRVMGFPWSPELVERSRRSTGATLAAARAALQEGVAVNLAGGTHHAGVSRGQGFCVFNDAAVTAKVLLGSGDVGTVLVVDLDVHQGNGTAEILATEPRATTLSLHGARNFPFDKATSDIDVALPDGTTDADYLSALDDALQKAFVKRSPDLVIYLAGVDPYEGDKLGRLSLSAEGLLARDERVFAWCRQTQTPVAVVMAGGYAPDVDRIADLHLQTVRAAAVHHAVLRTA